MITRVLHVDPASPNRALIEQAAEVLRSGQPVAFPTETVYGLGANALDPAAVDRIFLAKERPATNPLIVHLALPADLTRIAHSIPDSAWQLIAVFWPGPLTLILPRLACVPANVTAGLDTIAVRMPAHPVARALIAAANVPLAAPSANRYTRPSPTTAAHVLEDLDGRIPLIVDGGPASIGIESTVLDLSGLEARILRPGGISLEQIQQILPAVVQGPPLVQEEGARSSPGLHLKHYSPRAHLICYDGSEEWLRSIISDELETYQQQGKRVAVLLPDEDIASFQLASAAGMLADSILSLIPLGSKSDLAQIARNLFACIREADAAGADVILTRAYPQSGIGMALNDRLFRAAEGEVRRNAST